MVMHIFWMECLLIVINSSKLSRELVADKIPIRRHPTSRSILPFSPDCGLFVRTGCFYLIHFRGQRR